MIAIVAAMDESRLIGVGGRLPWHSPADLAHFRAVTMGAAVIMGRRTYESIGHPLDGRMNVVVTRDRNFAAPVWRSGDLTRSVEARVALGWSAFVIGGASVYAQAMPHATRLYLTRIRHTFPVGDGAVRFPEWSGFRLAESKHREADAENPWPMDFETWERS